MAHSILDQTSINSPLLECSTLKPRGSAHHTELAPPLMLTSLIDTFSLLVVYLLMSFGSSGEFMMMSKGMVLPTLADAEMLDRQIIIKFEKGYYFVEDLKVSKNDLFPTLLKMREDFKAKYPELDSEKKVIIQADKKEKFLDLNFIIHASAQAGFEEIKFAVLTSS